MRIVNQPFPANRGTGLFKIDAHDKVKTIADLFRQGFKSTSILHRGFRIVDRARSTHHQQARIATGDDIGNGLARARDLRLLFNGQRELGFELIRSD